MNRDVICRGSFHVNGHEILGFLSGDQGFYNLTQIWEASPHSKDSRRSPAAYITSGSGRSFIESLAWKAGVPAERLIYRDGSGWWWATHQIAMDYTGTISNEFKILVYECAGRWAKRKAEELALQKQARHDGKLDHAYKCDVIKAQLNPGPREKSVYGITTNETYLGITGKDAKGLRESMGLGKKDSIRDHLDALRLSAIGTAERAAADKMIVSDVRTCSGAIKAHRVAAQHIGQALRAIENESI